VLRAYGRQKQQGGGVGGGGVGGGSSRDAEQHGQQQQGNPFCLKALGHLLVVVEICNLRAWERLASVANR
jgi:hypothetical protein